MRKASWVCALIAVFAAMFCAAPVFAAVNPGYVDWWTVAGQPGNGSSPHGGYSASTTKCVVCHSTHQASASPDSEVLLQSSAADACIYCHVNTASSYTQVYDGDSALYAGTDYPNGHNLWTNDEGIIQGVKCTQCHSVHAAASEMTSSTELTQKMLRAVDFRDNDVPQYSVTATDTKDQALTKWCGGCHFTLGSQPGIAGDFLAPDHQWAGSPVVSTSHIMTTATAQFDNPAATFNGKVAFKDSSYCSSCHSSGYGTPAFPHYTTGVKMLESAENASSTAMPATKSTDDGVCLRCHRDGAGKGVGLEY